MPRTTLPNHSIDWPPPARLRTLRSRIGRGVATCDVTKSDTGCLNAIADPQAMQVMLSALFAYALHTAQQKEKA